MTHLVELSAPSVDLTRLSAEELAEGICLRAGRIAAASAELLTWIAEFDRREGWSGPGMLSCAHWLSWRIGLSPVAAREQVRVARRLEQLPLLAEAFALGTVSYSKIRAITRVAASDDSIDWLALARSSSAAQLERLVRGVRRARAFDEAPADPEDAAYRVRTRERWDDQGNLALTIYLPAAEAAVFRAGLAAQRREIERQREASGTGRGSENSQGASAEAPPAEAAPRAAAVRDGEVLLAMARAALTAEAAERPAASRRHRADVVAQVDPLSGWARLRDGELLPPTSLRALLKTLPGRQRPDRLRPLTAADLRVHDLGRTQREPSLRLRELLGTIDGERCRFPGYTRHRNLHAHHVVYWSRGGATDLSNLVLLCSRHHTLVHMRDIHLTLHQDRRLDVVTAEGVPVVHHPAQPWGDPAELDPDGQVSAESLAPVHSDARLDLGYAVSVVLQQAA